jgi:tetratricopeptide (TPR) repeat protein
VDGPRPVARPMPVLTRRERDVLAALCGPLASDRPVAMPASIRDIAAELVVTQAAIKQHLLNLYDKFEVAEGTESRRIALAREAVLRGFLPGVGAPAPIGDSALDEGRTAAKNRAWDDAYVALSEAASARSLDVGDLESLGDAATWTGRFDASTAAREQAYAAYLSLGDRRSAARVALGLGWNAAVTLRFSVVAGWMASAGRLLAADEVAGDTSVWPEHGLLLSLMALGELGSGQVDAGLEHARAAFNIGLRTGDPDIQALGLVFQGFGLVHQGRLDEGRVLLDEAMASATAGHLGTLAQGMVYCRTLSACLDTFDYRRAIEWTEAIERRAPALGTVGFPGDCRTHRAAVLVVRGDWELGAEEAEAAAVESRAYDLGHTVQALTALGEIRLRQGDLAAARDAFERAAEFGLPLGPGPALALLAAGDAIAAHAAITGALHGAGDDRLTRARYLPAAIEIALAAGDRDGARRSSADLADIAAGLPGPVLAAAAAECEGAVSLADGEAAAAIVRLRDSAIRWRAVGAPYESARCRMRVASAAAALGDRGDAAREGRAALSRFEQLGARLDIKAATAFLDHLEPPVS